MTLGAQLRRLGRHSAVYGIGGIVSRVLAVLLLPLYTRYLTTEDFGAVGLLVALNAVLVTVLRLGISAAFFRFYFDAEDDAGRRLVVRTSFWFTMAMATIGLVLGLLLAYPIAELLSLEGQEELVAAAFVGLWAQMNFEQQTALFRVEERSTAYVIASLANIAITVERDRLARRRPRAGRTRRDRGELVGTLDRLRGAPRGSSSAARTRALPPSAA